MTVTNRVFSDHRIHALLERSIDAAKKLENIYEDEDGLRKEEVSKIGGPNEFKEFYERKWFLKTISKKNPKSTKFFLEIFQNHKKIKTNKRFSSYST